MVVKPLAKPACSRLFLKRAILSRYRVTDQSPWAIPPKNAHFATLPNETVTAWMTWSVMVSSASSVAPSPSLAAVSPSESESPSESSTLAYPLLPTLTTNPSCSKSSLFVSVIRPILIPCLSNHLYTPQAATTPTILLKTAQDQYIATRNADRGRKPGESLKRRRGRRPKCRPRMKRTKLHAVVICERRVKLPKISRERTRRFDDEDLAGAFIIDRDMSKSADVNSGEYAVSSS
mmetsp:Transcript_1613/g.2883  ORF Transcript_1613/g.2883 Transcript_1613/m.2883 type:complete len:234 (+) Transcript_1613:514-1215(+)